MVLSNGILFVANLVSDQHNNPGSVLAYNARGALVGTLTPDATFNHPFHPRGVVIGPDGKLYVSVVGVLDPSSADFDPLAGYVLRFNAETGKFIDVFAQYDPTADDCSTHLHRPEGLGVWAGWEALRYQFPGRRQ